MARAPNVPNVSLSVAIVGSGPAGCYTAEALLKRCGADVAIDIIDCLPTPFGLVRAGVAPDHQSIKGVARRFEATAASPNVRLLGNIAVGWDISVADLVAAYDAVVLATGAPLDRTLGIPGDDLPGVIGSAAFVGWYNGHPDHAMLDVRLDCPGAVVVGNGNVALDCARILAKTPEELAASDIVAHARDELKESAVRHITILGRRGPHQVSFTRQELAEMGELARARPKVDPAQFPPEEADAALDPAQRKIVQTLRGFAGHAARETPVVIDFAFLARPLRIEGRKRVERLVVERTRLEGDRAVGTGETFAIPCGLVIPCIGYQTSPIPGVPFDETTGRFANTDGYIAPGLYTAGWARRGPSGTIGTNRADGDMVATAIATAGPAPGGRAGPAALDRLAAERRLRTTTLTDWRALDSAEVMRARGGAPREKFVALDHMLATIAATPAT